MKIFLTGGTGFIGAHFINEAHKSGYFIKALRRSEKSKPKIHIDKEPIWLNKSYNEVNENDLKDCDILVHLAAHSANIPYDNLNNCIEYNVIQPLSLFKKAKNAQIEKFIVAGSCFEYGKSANFFQFIPTNAPLEPTLSYPTSKAMSSLAFRHFAVTEKIRLTYNRIFQVYGEGELESRLWPSIKKAAISGKDLPMTKGEQVRDFIHVSDVVKNLLNQCSRNFELTPGLPQFNNIGTGKPQSILDFTKYWWEYFEAKGKLKIGELDYREEEVFRIVPEL